MHPGTFLARNSLQGIGYSHGDRFSQITVHEGYELKIVSDMPDVNTFVLKIELLDLEKGKQSVPNRPQLNFSFLPEYIPITGPHALQSTYLTAQMAGKKRTLKDENAYVPEIKRRVILGGQDGRNNSATPLSKGMSKDSLYVAQKPVFIDLSSDEEQPVSNLPQPAKAFMKSLPPRLSTGDFPCFDRAAVYFIIHPKNVLYQYRLHKAVLSRISPLLAKVLQRPGPKEAMEKLKVACTDAEARFELTYSHKLDKWMLVRSPFTSLRQPISRLNMAAVEAIKKRVSIPSIPSNDTPDLVLGKTFQPESGNHEVITTTPGVLTKGVITDHIAIINVAENGENDFEKDCLDKIPAVSHPVDSLTQNIQPEPVEHEKKSITYEEFVSSKPDESGQGSVDQLVLKLDAELETREVNPSLTNLDPEQIIDNVASLEGGQIGEKEQEGAIVIISSFVDGETQALATKTEHVSPNNGTEMTQPLSASVDLPDQILESAEFEGNSLPELVEDKQVTVNSISTPDKVQLYTKESIEESIDPGIIQRSAAALSEPAAVTGPPIELCEAYNNLFLIFYSKPPAISSTSISVALGQCEALISIASRLDCLPVIRPYLAYALCQFGKELYMSVAAEPFRWLNIAMVLRSADIFRESLIHIVATYVPGPEGQINLPEDTPVRDLIVFKVRQLDQQRMDVNERLFSSSIIVGSETVTFSFVDATILSTWLVVQIWRDWFCRQMAGVHFNPHKTGQLYRTLAESGDAYLTITEVKTAIEKITHPVKVDLDELKEDLGLLKKFAQEAVKELCENNSMFDVREAGIGYLTCTKIMDEELPWFESRQ